MQKQQEEEKKKFKKKSREIIENQIKETIIIIKGERKGVYVPDLRNGRHNKKEKL